MSVTAPPLDPADLIGRLDVNWMLAFYWPRPKIAGDRGRFLGRPEGYDSCDDRPPVI